MLFARIAPIVAMTATLVSAVPAPRRSFAEALLFARADTHDHSDHDHSDNTTASAFGSFSADFPIHESCNGSQRIQIQQGLRELNVLAEAAVTHLMQYGNSSDLFKTYFGEGADPAVPAGIFSRIIHGNKEGTLFRCDNIDGNCGQPGWNGHWRGNNATGETVICDLSFVTRLPITKFCANGFQLARDNVNVYWATDLLHRAMHLPGVTNDHVVHISDSYEAVLELAQTQPNSTVYNQHTIQDFAFEVYSRQWIDPNGCVGEVTHSHDDAAHGGNSTAPVSSTVSSAVATATATASGSAAPAATSSAGQDCHTHADGVVHCV